MLSLFLKDNKIEYTHTNYNSGICTGMNLAAKKAIYDYILYAHDDFYFCPKWDVVLKNEVQKINHNKYDQVNDVGEISHFQALASHLAATIGMGNISGVAVAIATGGPGAIFWMWVSALFGMSTKFFTCTLAVMYRGKDSNGDVQGGPMYVIEEGMGIKWRPLAVFFCLAGVFGATPIFQSNQIIAAANEIIFQPAGIEASLFGDLVMGLVLTLLTGIVIFGAIQRIGIWAARLVPAMVILYLISVACILFLNTSKINN